MGTQDNPSRQPSGQQALSVAWSQAFVLAAFALIGFVGASPVLGLDGAQTGPGHLGSPQTDGLTCTATTTNSSDDTEPERDDQEEAPAAVFDATVGARFPDLTRLDVMYHANLTDRSGKLMARVMKGAVLDTVQLDRQALNNTSRHELERVELTVRQVVAQARWIDQAGGTPRYYNAIPMSGHYNLIRSDPAAFAEKVIGPIAPMLEVLPVLDATCYFKQAWYADFKKFWPLIKEVSDELAALGKKMNKPIAVWVWVDRYQDQEHLKRHTDYLVSIGLQVVYWGRAEQPDEA